MSSIFIQFGVVLNKNFVGPTGSACRQASDKVRQLLKFTGLVYHLENSSWIIELEHALERFSIPTYLDWFDQQHLNDRAVMDNEFPEGFLNYLKDKVSNPCS